MKRRRHTSRCCRIETNSDGTDRKFVSDRAFRRFAPMMSIGSVRGKFIEYSGDG